MRINVFTRRVVVAVLATLVVALPFSYAGAIAPPYPATLTMQRGMLFSHSVDNEPRWGTKLSAAQAHWVTITSAMGTNRWGVWRLDGVSETFPVRSVDGGTTWREAGPLLATDWVGGGLYYVSKVFSEGPHTVVMVSNSVIDVSTDGGHRWYQYLNTWDNWDITAYATRGAIALRVTGASYARLPKGSYALYLLDVAHHQWHRVRQSMS